MFRYLSTSAFLLIAFVELTTAKSRFVRQIEEEGSGSSDHLNFIDFNNETANPIYPLSDDSVLQEQQPLQQQPQDGSEGSGAQQLNFINFDEGSGNQEDQFQAQNLTFENAENTQPKEFVQSINLTDSNVETLVIRVHLPPRDSANLIEDLKDQSEQQTSLPNNLDMAVSLTSLLNEVLGRIQGSSTD